MPEIAFTITENGIKKTPGKLICLNDLFPNLDASRDRKRQRNIEKRKKAKENAKKRKMEAGNPNNEVIMESHEEKTTENETYKGYCSRLI